MRRRLLVLRVLVVALTLAAAALTGTAASWAGPRPDGPVQPVLTGDFPDPTIAAWRGGYVSVATGSMAPRAVAPSAAGPWTRTSAALGSLPPWASDDAVWASDLVRVGGRWRLYFSAPARGLVPGGRCIGVAVAATPVAVFRPDPDPLVCPAGVRGGTAYDQVNPAGVPFPAGVIDPEVHQDGDGLLLLYRTQGVPSTIRVVPLDATGRTATQPASTTLVVSSGVVENPLLVRRGPTWVLITSEGYFGSCDYRTTFQRATSLEALAVAPREELARRGTTGLCGPGGADLVGRTLFLHAWTCPAGRPRCRASVEGRRVAAARAAKRSLYAARLGWSPSGAPRIRSFLGGRAATGVVPARRDPVVQGGPFPVPTGAGDALPADTVLGLPGLGVRADAR